MQNNTFSGLFVGQNVIALRRVDSTNNYLKNLLAKSKPLPEGTVIMAEEQYAGRGQFDNQWLAQPGKNLTFSLLLCPSFLNPHSQFLLNMAVSIAINDVLTRILGEDCKIKWPNDIFFKNSKLGGILTENVLSGKKWKYSVIGIGINVNQTEFPESIKNVTSLKSIIGKTFSLPDLLAEICQALEKRYLELREDRSQSHQSEYLSNLYFFKREADFKTSDSTTLRGKITGIDDKGRLILEINGELQYFGLKEISYETGQH